VPLTSPSPGPSSSFGTAGGSDDPISVAVGGPVMSKFVDSLEELRSYKEVLETQVEHMLVDRISKFRDFELHNLRDVRRSSRRPRTSTTPRASAACP